VALNFQFQWIQAPNLNLIELMMFIGRFDLPLYPTMIESAAKMSNRWVKPHARCF